MAIFEDTTRYIRIPTRTAAGCLSLARALIVAAPAKGEVAELVHVRLESMYDAASALQEAWIAAMAVEEAERPRQYDRRVDRGWAIILDRLGHWLEIDDADRAAKAEELIARIYPTGLDFTGFAYNEEWAESDKRLRMIESEGLAEPLTELVGASFVDHLQDAHGDYGDVLGITAKKPEPEPARVQASIRALRVAISDYAMLIVALTDRNDAEAVAKAERWLEPIPRFRVPRGANETVEETPDEPLPELPTES